MSNQGNALSSFAIPDNAWDLSAERSPAGVPVRYLAGCEGRVLRVAVDPSVPEDLPVRELALLAPPSDRLEALWGERARRISHATALARAVPLKAGVVVDASGPPVPADAAHRLGVNAHPEIESTVTLRARLAWGNTWISLPDRALLECLQSGCGCNDAAVVAGGIMFDGLGPCPEQVRNTAETLGLGQALRRLASIAAVLADINDPRPGGAYSLLAESHATYLDTPMCDDEVDWIWVRPGEPAAGRNVTFRDDRWRVLWDQGVASFAEDVLY